MRSAIAGALALSLLAGCPAGSAAPQADSGPAAATDAGAGSDGGGASAFDWRNGVMYFVFVDRFRDGDPANDAPIPGVEPQANYQGGDLKGVKDEIDAGYFNDLGVNVLWLTSPVDNADSPGVGTDGYLYTGYHGYWPSHLDRVESHIGTINDLRAVVDAAHAHGIRVILDYVMNHVYIDSPTYKDHPDWFWPLSACGVCGSPGCSWNGEQGKMCWFTSYLPDFNFQNPDARAFSVNNAIQWAKETGIDGFRLDAVKQIEDQWIIDLRKRVQSEIVTGNQVFYMVGETFTGDRDTIKHYVDPTTMLDGQFDFPFRAAVVGGILERQGSMTDLANFLQSNDTYYGSGAVMSPFLGNHDLPRSIGLAEDTPLFGVWDNGQNRAWQNRPTLPTTKRPFERLATAYAVLLTSPGLPMLYYGDEIGMPGAGDPDNRRFMQWDNLTDNQVWLRNTLAKLIHIREAHAALTHGTRTNLDATNDTYVFKMDAGGDEVVVALNRSDGALPAQGIPAGSYRDLMTDKDVTAPLMIPARSFLLLAPK